MLVIEKIAMEEHLTGIAQLMKENGRLSGRSGEFPSDMRDNARGKQGWLVQNITCIFRSERRAGDTDRSE